MRKILDSITNAKFLGTWIAAASMTLISGCACGGSPVSDPVKAEELLSTALEAWKSGSTSSDLEKGASSIVMFDPDWNSGIRLESFEPQPARLAGNNVTLPVKLTLKTGKGRKVQRTAVYAITTEPVKLIVREEG